MDPNIQGMLAVVSKFLDEHDALYSRHTPGLEREPNHYRKTKEKVDKALASSENVEEAFIAGAKKLYAYAKRMNRLCGSCNLENEDQLFTVLPLAKKLCPSKNWAY